MLTFVIAALVYVFVGALALIGAQALVDPSGLGFNTVKNPFAIVFGWPVGLIVLLAAVIVYGIGALIGWAAMLAPKKKKEAQ